MSSDGRPIIFVFGSNLSGKHGAGAALYALKHHRAIYGQGVGLQGFSYAIPTKDFRIQTLPLHEIKKYVADFISFAQYNNDLYFHITKIGSGLAGYDWEKDIRPLFPQELPENCEFIDG